MVILTKAVHRNFSFLCRIGLRPFYVTPFVVLPLLFGCSPPVATVNGKHISAKEFRYTLEHTYGTQTLRWLITKRLLDEENERLKLVTDAEVDSALDEFKASHGGEAQFQLWLRRNNRTVEDVREDLKRDLIMFKLRSSKVSEKQLQEFYERNKHIYVQPPVVRVSVIMSNKKEDIVKAKSELDSGKPFGIVARRYSSLQYLKASGGDLGEIPNGYYKLSQAVWTLFYQTSPEAFNVVRKFSAEVWKTINTVPFNNPIGPIQSDGHWLIIRVMGKRDAYQLPFKEVRHDVLTRYLDSVGPSEAEIERELWRKAKIQIHWAEYKPLEDIYKEAEWMKLPVEQQ